MRYFVTGSAPGPLGTRHPSATPFQAFPTADRRIVVALGFGDENQWGLFCSLLGLPDLIDDPRFDTGPKRTVNHSELEPLLVAAFREHPASYWLDEFLAVGIPCGPVNTIPEVVADAQIRHREMIQEVTHPVAGTIPIANTPLRFSRSESGIRGAPPSFGENTAEVLQRLLGLSADEVVALEGAGVVATSGGPNVDELLH